MSDSHITRMALASSLKKLMETEPLAKISVGDICKACGVGRQTFYYHFQDKFDLMNWICYNDMADCVRACPNLETWSEVVEKVVLALSENRTFYMNALQYTGQNSFSEYLFEVFQGLVSSFIEEAVTPRPPARDREFTADFYAFALVGVISKWISGGMKETPREFSAQIIGVVGNHSSMTNGTGN